MAAIVLLALVAAGLPRGAHPDDHARYADDHEQHLTCDGRKTLPHAYINDQYCDCADGTDEPGTSACLHATFYCANRRFRPQTIRASRVDDGVCDCCDGSDEPPAACNNSCDEAGREYRAAAAARVARIRRGLNAAREWAASGAKARAAWEVEVAEADRRVAEAEAHASNLEEAKRLAEEKEEEMRAELKAREAAVAAAAAEERRAQVERQLAECEATLSPDGRFADAAICGDAPEPVCIGSVDGRGGKEFASRCAVEAAGYKSVICTALMADGPCNATEAGADASGAESSDASGAEGADSVSAEAAAASDEAARAVRIDAEGSATGTDEGDTAPSAGAEGDDEVAEAQPSVDEEMEPPPTGEDGDSGEYGDSGEHGDSGEDVDSEYGYSGEDDEHDYHAEDEYDPAAAEDDYPGYGEDNPSYDDDDFYEGDEGDHNDDSDADEDPAAPSVADRTDEVNHPEAERLRGEFASAEKAVREAKKRQRELKELLDKDFGSDGRWEPLRTQCFEFNPGGEFTYKMCPFHDAQQISSGSSSGTKLGSWRGFEDGSKQFVFDGGQYCWNAGARTLTVTLTCSDENAITSVDEPEVCRYAMAFSTPAACTNEDADEADQVERELAAFANVSTEI